MNHISALLRKYKGPLAYLIFGVITTAVNLIAYYLLYETVGLANTPSVVIAWILAVAAAFLTNKPFVFESHDWSIPVLLPEIGGFLSCRIGTGLMELVFMHITVDIMQLDGMLMKLLINILVIILNYVGSKLLVFRKK